MKKKICVFTGGRQEYGILKPLLFELKKSNKINLQLVASGMHLSNEFGLTYKNILEDGFKIDDKIEIVLSSDTPISISKSMGLLMQSFSETLSRLKPDYLILLGDRFETFAAASCALVARIPIIHIQGGELTIGAIDEAFRHSITKMSSYHFVYAEEYRKRVIQLGEDPSRIYNYGALNVDSIKKTKLLKRKDLYDQLFINKKYKDLILVTFHPVTLQKDSSKKNFQNILNFLSHFKDNFIVFTKTNADTEGRIINHMIDKYVALNKNAAAYKSLGQIKYLSALKYSKFVIGNSSSGIIETPYFKKPTINIGIRESGRIKASNVIDSGTSINSLKKAYKILTSEKFNKKLRKMKNPFDRGNTSLKIIKKIEKLSKSGSTVKKFYDLN